MGVDHIHTETNIKSTCNFLLVRTKSSAEKILFTESVMFSMMQDSEIWGNISWYTM